MSLKTENFTKNLRAHNPSCSLPRNVVYFESQFLLFKCVEWWCILFVKSYVNEENCKQWRQQTNACDCKRHHFVPPSTISWFFLYNVLKLKCSVYMTTSKTKLNRPGKIRLPWIHQVQSIVNYFLQNIALNYFPLPLDPFNNSPYNRWISPLLLDFISFKSINYINLFVYLFIS